MPLVYGQPAAILAADDVRPAFAVAARECQLCASWLGDWHVARGRALPCAGKRRCGAEMCALLCGEVPGLMYSRTLPRTFVGFVHTLETRRRRRVQFVACREAPLLHAYRYGPRKGTITVKLMPRRIRPLKAAALLGASSGHPAVHLRYGQRAGDSVTVSARNT